ncbi:MAG: endonuclease/exonuclease/phosphatase family protein [Bacteroidales bacterium]
MRDNKNMAVLFMVFLIGVFAPAKPGKAQESGGEKAPREFVSLCVGFYNVENLFDTINNPLINDDEFTPEGRSRWNSERYFEKLENLARVIEQMGKELNPDGPAVLGLSEVENPAVLEDLASQEAIRDRDYQVVFHQGPDLRGIHVAFLYQPKYFRYISSKAYPTVIEGRPDFRTRDQILLTGELLGERMHFIVAHWPSRRGGERRSRPLRIAKARIARHIIDSIQAAEPGAKVVFMGDLNDNPTDISIRRHLRATGSRQDIAPDQLFNPFESHYRRGIGSNAYRDSWSLFDQVLVSPGLLGDDFSSFRYFRAEVFNKPFLRQASGRFQGYPFRSYGGGVYLGGYSDHFPTYVFLIREK